MKKCFFGLFFVVLLAALPAQQNPSITIVNNTGYTVWYVYMSQTASNSWGNDLLKSDEILSDGTSVSLQLPFPLNVVNRYDIRLEDSDGDTYTKMNVMVRANSAIVFTFDDIDEEAAESFDGPPVTIVNNTGYTIYYVYISKTTSDSWGSDRLGRSETISNGDSVSLQLPHPVAEVSRYDIKLEDSDGDSYTKMNVLVAANSRIVFTKDDMD
ncbi:MAG: hypothetical protein FWG99_06480 [Treponema sp.]|nr:hypothetical protein [Treponema sp.]